MAFLFEKLDAYVQAVDFADQIDQLVDQNQNRLSRTLADQLSRAALSIPLNLAEGNGRWHKADKKQFYYIARGSASECLPPLELAKRRNLISEQQYAGYYQQLENLSKMISGLIKSVELREEARV